MSPSCANFPSNLYRLLLSTSSNQLPIRCLSEIPCNCTTANDLKGLTSQPQSKQAGWFPYLILKGHLGEDKFGLQLSKPSPGTQS